MKRIAVLFLGLTLSVSAVASKRNSDASFGLGVGVGSVSVDDPSGPAQSTLTFYPSFIYLLNVSRDERLLSEFSYMNYSLDASGDDIGQKVTSLSITGIYEWRKRFTRDFKPWFGLGLGYGSDSISKRHTIDEDGFLRNIYADREAAGLSVILNTSIDIKVEKTDLLLRGTVTLPRYDGLSGFGVSLIYLF